MFDLFLYICIQKSTTKLLYYAFFILKRPSNTNTILASGFHRKVILHLLNYMISKLMNELPFSLYFNNPLSCI